MLVLVVVVVTEKSTMANTEDMLDQVEKKLIIPLLQESENSNQL